jgi:adenylyltransferase/sulfurtransferase
MGAPNHGDRYSRQVLFEGIGEEGQRRLAGARVAIIGCGALGSAQADALARAGIGSLRIIDRDFVEVSNLQRQSLFDEADAQAALPKAVAAERKLRQINSDVQIEGRIADLVPENAEELLDGFSLFMDGTDNFETRLLLNDAAVGSYGLSMAVVPGQTACLNCLLERSDQTGLEETCDTVGIINPAVDWVAALQVSQALQLLVGRWSLEQARLVRGDLWRNHFTASPVPRPRPDCACCGAHRFTHLAGKAQPRVTLCGRNAVQIHERGRALDMDQLHRRLAPYGEVRHNEFLVRLRVSPYVLTFFSDGRAIIQGTTDPAVARSLYARFLGA